MTRTVPKQYGDGPGPLRPDIYCWRDPGSLERIDTSIDAAGKFDFDPSPELAEVLRRSASRKRREGRAVLIGAPVSEADMSSVAGHVSGERFKMRACGDRTWMTLPLGVSDETVESFADAIRAIRSTCPVGGLAFIEVVLPPSGRIADLDELEAWFMDSDAELREDRTEEAVEILHHWIDDLDWPASRPLSWDIARDLAWVVPAIVDGVVASRRGVQESARTELCEARSVLQRSHQGRKEPEDSCRQLHDVLGSDAARPGHRRSARRRLLQQSRRRCSEGSRPQRSRILSLTDGGPGRASRDQFPSQTNRIQRFDPSRYTVCRSSPLQHAFSRTVGG